MSFTNTITNTLFSIKHIDINRQQMFWRTAIPPIIEIIFSPPECL